MPKDLWSKLITIENLRWAWTQICTGADVDYKNCCRHLYAAFSFSSESNLRIISGMLQNEAFQPSASTKLFFPKKSGILRPYTILSIVDQIVYQAIANILVHELYDELSSNYFRITFGHVCNRPPSKFFYVRWGSNYLDSQRGNLLTLGFSVYIYMTYHVIELLGSNVTVYR